MFLHSRFTVVDDKEHHLKAIKNTLDALRVDCHTKLYDVETIHEWSPLPGTRLLFIDKNLRPGLTMGGDDKDAFSAIAEVIQIIISPDSGPYGMILWAENPQIDELKKFLFERFKDEDRKLLPVFFTELRKGDYINTDSGEPLDPEKLKSDLLEKMGASHQMKALFSWESDVAVAMDAVLRSITDLVPIEVRATNDFGNELGKVLFRLSQAGAGINRAMENPREAINRVLVPILADRILEHDPQGDAIDSWKGAIVQPAEKATPAVVQAAVNSAIHLSSNTKARPTAIKATDLGAVVEFPFNDCDNALEQHFGISKAKIMDDSFFGITEDDWQASALRLVQIGAACDHAQPKAGPVQYLLAIEWPFANADGSKKEPSRRYAKKSLKNDLEWRSPFITVLPSGGPGRISVFLNCTLSVPRAVAEDWTSVHRFREELISKLTQDYARYISRPGILTLSPDN